MFRFISWQTYFIAFVLVAGLYYGVLIFLFLKREWKTRIKGFQDNRSSASQNAWEGDTKREDDRNDYATYQFLRDEITAFLESAEPETFKSDILLSLVSIVKKHPHLQDERFQEALNKEIRRMYLQKYNDGITEEDLSALWQA